MPEQTRNVSPGPEENTVRTPTGEVLRIPEGWTRVPPGDAALTRRIKAAGPSWTVQQKRGRKIFSLGVWAAASMVAAIQAELVAERSTVQHARKKEADARRRQRQQTEYVQSFRQAVVAYLAFAPRYATLAEQLAEAVTRHATPVGSGTVARTERIPIERRAEAAVTAWMRHQTTAYDRMVIPRIKGKRREVRRLLAEQTRSLLALYRQGADVDTSSCPLQQALSGSEREQAG